MVQKILINKNPTDFSLSRLTYTWLMKKKGWQFIGMYPQETDALTEVARLKGEQIAPVPVMIYVKYTSGGKVTPPVGQTPFKGGDAQFTCTLNQWYRVKSVVINGYDCGAVSKDIHLCRLDGDTHLLVMFAKYTLPAADKIPVCVFATPGGYTSHKGWVEGTKGQTFTFTAQPYPGYTYRKILVDGVEQVLENVTSADKTFTLNIPNIQETHNIEIHFKLEPDTCGNELPILESQKPMRYIWENIYGQWNSNINARDDAELVEAVQTLQSLNPDSANGICTAIKVVEIPDDIDWEIKVDCNRCELVASKFDTWR